MAKVASSSSVNGGNGTTIGVPSGTAQGDVFVLMITTRLNNTGSYSEITTPTGYTLLGNVRGGTGLATINSSLYYKVAGASEPGVAVACDAAAMSALMLRVTGWLASYLMTDFASNTYSSGTTGSTNNAYTITAPTLSAENNLVLILTGENSTSNITPSATAITFTQEVKVGSLPDEIAFSAQVPSGTSFPVTTLTPATAGGSQFNTVFFLSIPCDRVLPSALHLVPALGVPAFVRLVIVASLSATATVNALAASGAALTKHVRNVAKSAVSMVRNITKH